MFTALDALNRVSILHADVKPDNIMLANNDDLKVKLIDFGMAFQDSEVCTGIVVQPVPYRYLYYVSFAGVVLILPSDLQLTLRLSSSGLQKCSSACRSVTALTCGEWAVSSCTFTSKRISSLFAVNIKWSDRHLSHTSKTRRKLFHSHRFTSALLAFVGR